MEHETAGCTGVAVTTVLANTAGTAVVVGVASAPFLRIPVFDSASSETRCPASEWHVTQGPAPACLECENLGPV